MFWKNKGQNLEIAQYHANSECVFFPAAVQNGEGDGWVM